MISEQPYFSFAKVTNWPLP